MAQTNPTGQANTIQKIMETIAEMADNIFKDTSKTGMWAPNAALVRGFQQAKKGELPTITLQGLGDYDKAKGYPEGSVTLEWTPYELRYDRARSFLLDAVDVMTQKGQLEFSYVFGELMRTQVVPEVDAINIAAVTSRLIADGPTANKEYGYTPATSSIIGKIGTMIRKVKNATYIDTGLNVLVNMDYAEMLDNSTEVQKTRDVQSSVRRVDGIVEEINGVPLTYVSNSVMMSDIETKAAQDGSAGGFAKGAADKEPVFIVTAPGCVNAINAHTATKIIMPEQNQTADGTKVMFRSYFDCIVPKNKVPGIAAVFKGAAPGP